MNILPLLLMLTTHAVLDGPLRICADPNNLPFSDREGRGFENHLAELLAKELGTTVEYTWHPQRRGFIRNTLKAKRCDVVLGINADAEQVKTTRPYYRSTYAFVQRNDDEAPFTSLNDSRLRRARVGVQMVGDDYANTPPVHALARRGIVDNVKGYSVLGDYGQASPTRSAVEAVAKGEVDVAIVWGPQAGYFARLQRPRLRVTPIRTERDGALPFAFDIALAVRSDDTALAGALQRALDHHRREVRRLLLAYGVPTRPKEGAP